MKKLNLLLILGLIFIVLSSSVSALSNFTGVRAYWSFEMPQQMLDKSGKGFTLTKGSSITNATGYNPIYSIYGIKFNNTDVNDYLNFNGNAMPSKTGTISFRLKYYKNDGTGNDFIIYAYKPGGAGFRMYILVQNANELCVRKSDDTGCSNTYTLTRNRDYLVTVKYNNLTLRTELFINKTRISSGVNSGLANFTGTTASIGYSGAGNHPDMDVDEVMFFGRNITTSELNSIYECNDIYCSGTILNKTILALNYWDNSSISSFNSTITYRYINNTFETINLGTTTGTLLTTLASNTTGCYKWNGGTSYTRINCLVNITNYKTNTYFNKTTLNYNITANLQDILKQNQVNISVRELFTNNSVSNVVIKVNGTTKINTTDSWGIIYPKTGNSYSITVFDRLGAELYHSTSNSLSVSALQNITKYVYVHQHYITIKARNALTNVSINSFNVTVDSLNISDTRELGTTTGTLNIPVIHNTYNVTIIAPNYALYNNSKLFVITSNQTHTFYLYLNNSITFNIYNLSSLKLTNKIINIELIGEHGTYNYVTSNGTKFTGSIIPDVTYRCIFTSSSFNTQTQYITLLGGEHRLVNVYLDSGLTTKTFNVKDATNNLNLEGVILTFYELINGSQVSVGQLTTDYFGSGSVYLNSNKYYSFTATKTNYTDFTGTITPTESSYPFSMNRIVGTEFNSVFNSIYMPSPTFNYYPLIGKAFNQYIITSSSGVVNYFGYNYTYDGVYYITNLSTSPQGGILSNNFTIDIVAQNNITIHYFYKIAGNDEYSFNKNYFIGYTPENFTIASGIFDDLEDLSGTSGYWKGIIAYIIIVALIVILLKLTGNMNIAILGGLGGFVIAWSYNLLPHNLILLSGGIIIFFWFIEKAWMDS